MTKLELIEQIKELDPNVNVGRLWAYKKHELEEKLKSLIDQKENAI